MSDSLDEAPKGKRPETLALMRRSNALFLKRPFYGGRGMALYLRHIACEA